MSDAEQTTRVETVRIERRNGESDGAATARHLLGPAMQAASTHMCFPLANNLYNDTGLNDLIGELQAHCDAVNGGDLTRAETMLTAQAHTLDAIFNNLARRAARNFGEYPEAGERYLKLALRAQGQCRASLETLGAIKNPPNVAFVKQANIANGGNQQVNNGVMPAAPARTQETQSTPIKLLEAANGERLDIGAPAAASGGHSTLAAVGAIDRPADGGRESESEPQRLQGRRAARVATAR